MLATSYGWIPLRSVTKLGCGMWIPLITLACSFPTSHPRRSLCPKGQIHLGSYLSNPCQSGVRVKPRNPIAFLFTCPIPSHHIITLVKHRTLLPAAPVHNRDSVLTRQVQVSAPRRDLAQGQVKGQQGPRCPSLYGLVSCLVQCRPEPAVPGQLPCWVIFELGPDGQV